jgi:hypothetical protein
LNSNNNNEISIKSKITNLFKINSGENSNNASGDDNSLFSESTKSLTASLDQIGSNIQEKIRAISLNKNSNSNNKRIEYSDSIDNLFIDDNRVESKKNDKHEGKLSNIKHDAVKLAFDKAMNDDKLDDEDEIK